VKIDRDKVAKIPCKFVECPADVAGIYEMSAGALEIREPPAVPQPFVELNDQPRPIKFREFL
jgi:hypothetical protein